MTTKWTALLLLTFLTCGATCRKNGWPIVSDARNCETVEIIVDGQQHTIELDDLIEARRSSLDDKVRTDTRMLVAPRKLTAALADGESPLVTRATFPKLVQLPNGKVILRTNLWSQHEIAQAGWVQKKRSPLKLWLGFHTVTNTWPNIGPGPLRDCSQMCLPQFDDLRKSGDRITKIWWVRDRNGATVNFNTNRLVRVDPFTDR